MKIIDLAICIDNFDPKQIGRIRCVRYSDWISQKSKSFDYTKWDEKDVFIANPFLPLTSNFIPNVGQLVKIINYNTDKETVNQEYIAGPFTSQYDFSSQTFSQQIENTTYGVATKHRKDIIKSNGELVDKRTEGAFATNSDLGIYGKYGSDIVFTENGLQLRGGKLISKEFASRKEKENLLDFPLMAKTYSKISLKKFSKKMELRDESYVERKIEKGRLKYIIEYDTNNLYFTGNTNIQIYVYKVTKNKDAKDPISNIFDTDVFTEFTEIPITGYTELITGSTTGYTYSEEVDSVNGAYILLSDILSTIDEKNLFEIDQLLPNDDLHPYFFRPTKNFRERSMTPNELVTDRENIIKNVGLTGIKDGGSGLVWSILSPDPPVKEIPVVKKVLRTVSRNREQSFASVVADKTYLLSTDPTPTDKSEKIEFEKLNKYEYTQDDYLINIEPKTYSTVRGENLINFLTALYNVLLTHTHNINEPYGRSSYSEHEQLQNLFNTIKDDILNGSIRIN